MKLFFSIVLMTLCVFSSDVVAQQKKAPAIASVFIAAGSTENVYLLGADSTYYLYKENLNRPKTQKKKRSEVASLLMLEPKSYLGAIDLYEARKYADASIKFGEIAERYKAFKPIPDNVSTLAGFYQLECLRKQFKLKELKDAVSVYNAQSLVQKNLRRQVQIYKLWEAVEEKQWKRVEKLAKQWEKKKASNEQRAQIAYCLGLALENLQQNRAALNAYAVAMTIDYGNSQEITRRAAQNALRVYQSMPAVQNAMQQWGTSSANELSKGSRMLKEAVALVNLYTAIDLGGGMALPAEYKKFLKYDVSEQKEEK